MEPLASHEGGVRQSKNDPSTITVTDPYLDSLSTSEQVERNTTNDVSVTAPRPGAYRVYKRRWFGLIQLTLLNIVVSWDWLTFAPVSTTAASYFSTTESIINWLSTAFLFAFVFATPATMYALNKGGPKLSIIIASTLVLVGNWVRYAGTRAHQTHTIDGSTKGGVFGVVMLGQIIIGLAQPFVLSAPTRYSDMWFTERGRIAATALATLANAFGGALGQLIDPLWAVSPGDIPNMTLWVAIISTVASLPSFFIPSSPPTPPSSTSLEAHSTRPLNLKTLLRTLRDPSFHLLFWPFAIFVSAFNALSSLLNSILFPYGYSETAAGLTGGILIIVGLVSAALTSPLLDKQPALRIPFIKLLVPVVAAMYLAFVWAPQTRTIAAPYIIAAIIGAASFSLVPLALELLVEVTWPASPEVSSTLCWAGGQLGGAVCLLIMDNGLTGTWKHGQPPLNMKAGLVFLAVLTWTVVPLPLFLGWRGLGRRKREEAGRQGQAMPVE